jgi:hypothetical protein
MTGKFIFPLILTGSITGVLVSNKTFDPPQFRGDVNALTAGNSVYVIADTPKVKNPATDNIIFEVSPGCSDSTEGWRSFLAAHVNRDTPADNGAPKGTYTVVTRFIIDKQGHISDVKPLSNHGFGMEEEVVRTLRKSAPSPWTPATQNGHKVFCSYTMKFTFVVTKDDKKKNKKKRARNNQP